MSPQGGIGGSQGAECRPDRTRVRTKDRDPEEGVLFITVISNFRSFHCENIGASRKLPMTTDRTNG